MQDKDNNLNQINPQKLFAPLTQDEATQARWEEIIQLLEALALTEEEYLRFLNSIRHLLDDLVKNEREVKEEVEKLRLRKQLQEDDGVGV